MRPKVVVCEEELSSCRRLYVYVEVHPLCTICSLRKQVNDVLHPPLSRKFVSWKARVFSSRRVLILGYQNKPYEHTLSRDTALQTSCSRCLERLS